MYRVFDTVDSRAQWSAIMRYDNAYELYKLHEKHIKLADVVAAWSEEDNEKIKRVLERKDHIFMIIKRNRNSLNPLLRDLTVAMESRQFIRCTMHLPNGSLMQRKEYVLPREVDTPKYVSSLYHGLGKVIAKHAESYTMEKLLSMCKSYGIEGGTREEKIQNLARKPYDEFFHSKLSIGTIPQVAESVGTIVRDDPEIHADPVILRLAVHCAFAYLGYEPGSVRFYDLDKLIAKLRVGDFDVPDDKSSGILPTNTKPDDLKRTFTKPTNSPKKRVAKLAACKMVADILSEVKEAVKDLKPEDIAYGPLRDVFGQHVSLVTSKVRAVFRGEDQSKIRIFFIASLVDFILAKIFFEDVFKFHRHGVGSGIGHQWGTADGFRLSRSLEKFFKLIYFDFSKYDTTLKAVLLGLIAATFMCFAEDNKDINVWIALLMYLSDRMMIKIIQWFDGFWRLVIGQMHSGQYETSSINTIYALVFSFVVIIYWGFKTDRWLYVKRQLSRMIRLAKAGEWDKFETELDFFFLPFGDDQLWGFKGRMEEINLTFIIKVAADLFGMIIKYENGDECTTPYSEVDEFGTLILYPKKFDGDPESKIYMRPRGIKWLQRYWVNIYHPDVDWPIPMPYRETWKYYGRIGRTVSNISDPRMQLVRLYGLVQDNLLGNPDAMDMLLTCIVLMEKMWPDIKERVARDYNYMIAQDREMQDWIFKIEQRAGKGWVTESLAEGPNIPEQLKKYVRDCKEIVRAKEMYSSNNYRRVHLVHPRPSDMRKLRGRSTEYEPW